MSLMSQSRERAKARKAKEEKAKKKKGDEPTETFYEASNRLRRDLEKSGRRDLSGPTKEARETLEKRGRGVKPVSAAKADAKPAAKANGKAKETFKQAFAAARKEQGPGGKFTWNGKKYTTDRAEDKPKKTAGAGSKVGDAVAAIKKAIEPVGTETSPARKKIARKYKSSAPGVGANRKRGARQKSRMRKELRDAKTEKKVDAKAAAKAAPKQAAVEDKLAVKPKTGQKGKQLLGRQMAERARNSKEDKDEKILLGGARGKQAYGQRKSKGGSVKKSGYASGGKVRGVGAAKRGFGRGRTV